MSKIKNVMKAVTILLLLVSFAGCGKARPAVKELSKINNDSSRSWAEFVKKHGVNAITTGNQTLLIVAANSGNLDLVKACIKSGADVNLMPDGNAPALAYALGNNEIAEVLVKNKAKIKIGEYDMLAGCLRPYTVNHDVAKLLISKSAKKDLDYSESTRTIFVDETQLRDYLFNDDIRPIDSDLIEALDKKGFKPSFLDLMSLIDMYINRPQDDGDKIYTKIIDKNIQDTRYRNRLQADVTLLTILYNKFPDKKDEDSTSKVSKKYTIMEKLISQNYFLNSNFDTASNEELANNPYDCIVNMMILLHDPEIVLQYMTLFEKGGMDFNKTDILESVVRNCFNEMPTNLSYGSEDTYNQLQLYYTDQESFYRGNRYRLDKVKTFIAYAKALVNKGYKIDNDVVWPESEYEWQKKGVDEYYHDALNLMLEFPSL